MKNILSLHEAIVVALVNNCDRKATYAEIASFIEKRKLFTNRKGNILLEEQVRLRATLSSGGYKHLFEVINSETIKLRNI
ncbi:MAG: hypothetical protein A2W91_18325 [Bacteroidetes bacterium GWF2_38_335]|nr:MAG: hypothetical protein A2W91_18325 [Bacteroidetes bacterium GWF2_38_335]OFY80078.1 MAG: hypothetical protein A2281_12310 [Bacteroidetes bacterium RIFOXYA12_FULL_38_20]HBS88597.1 hypothetical protein [Bacteroidales bacterium]